MEGAVKLISDRHEVASDNRRLGQEAATDFADYLTDAVAQTRVTVFVIPRSSMGVLFAPLPRLRSEFYLSLLQTFSGDLFQEKSAGEAPVKASKPPVDNAAAVTYPNLIGWMLTVVAPILIICLGQGWSIEKNALYFLAIFSSTVVMWVNHHEVKVVFAGVNEEAAAYGYDKAENVTGILERLPLSALKETLVEMAQPLKLGHPARVMFLGDRSETVIADERYFSRFDWSPLNRVDSNLVETFDEWKDAIRSAEGKVDFIVVSNYRKVLRVKGEKELVPPKELIDWSEQNSKPPIIGTNVFFRRMVACWPSALRRLSRERWLQQWPRICWTTRKKIKGNPGASHPAVCGVDACFANEPEKLQAAFHLRGSSPVFE